MKKKRFSLFFFVEKIRLYFFDNDKRVRRGIEPCFACASVWGRYQLIIRWLLYNVSKDMRVEKKFLWQPMSVSRLYSLSG